VSIENPDPVSARQEGGRENLSPLFCAKYD
jgi:hypothetical protein